MYICCLGVLGNFARGGLKVISIRAILFYLIFLISWAPRDLLADQAPRFGSCEFVLSFLGRDDVPEDSSEIVAENLNWALFRRVYMPLALYKTKDRDLAEEVIQVASLKAFRAIKEGKLRSTKNIGGWLAVTLNRVALTEMKKAARRPKFLFDEKIDWQRTQFDPNINREGSLDKLRDFLSFLSIKEQSIFFAAHELGLKRREIAEALEIPLGSVLSGLHRAEQKVKAKLKSLSLRERQELADLVAR